MSSPMEDQRTTLEETSPDYLQQRSSSSSDEWEFDWQTMSNDLDDMFEAYAEDFDSIMESDSLELQIETAPPADSSIEPPTIPMSTSAIETEIPQTSFPILPLVPFISQRLIKPMPRRTPRSGNVALPRAGRAPFAPSVSSPLTRDTGLRYPSNNASTAPSKSKTLQSGDKKHSVLSSNEGLKPSSHAKPHASQECSVLNVASESRPSSPSPDHKDWSAGRAQKDRGGEEQKPDGGDSELKKFLNSFFEWSATPQAPDKFIEWMKEEGKSQDDGNSEDEQEDDDSDEDMEDEDFEEAILEEGMDIDDDEDDDDDDEEEEEEETDSSSSDNDAGEENSEEHADSHAALFAEIKCQWMHYIGPHGPPLACNYPMESFTHAQPHAYRHARNNSELASTIEKGPEGGQIVVRCRWNGCEQVVNQKDFELHYNFVHLLPLVC